MNYNVDLPMRNSISKDQWKMYEVTNQRFFFNQQENKLPLKLNYLCVTDPETESKQKGRDVYYVLS